MFLPLLLENSIETHIMQLLNVYMIICGFGTKYYTVGHSKITAERTENKLVECDICGTKLELMFSEILNNIIGNNTLNGRLFY